MASIRLAASNIGWTAGDDERVWGLMKRLGYTGLEIAPTRVFPERPYDHLNGAALFAGVMYQKYGFVIPSMQSIWYGQEGNIFEPEQAKTLEEYTVQALGFAQSCRCPSLVFGCPRNRAVPAGHSEAEAEGFFARLACQAAQQGAVIALEANPPVYNTNYLNTTRQALALVKKLALPGLAVNLDVGAMLYNGEQVADLANSLQYVSHIHISEPGLAPIERRPLHRQLALLLGAVGYKGFVSVEMKTSDYSTVERSLTYVAEVFA